MDNSLPLSSSFSFARFWPRNERTSTIEVKYNFFNFLSLSLSSSPSSSPLRYSCKIGASKQPSLEEISSKNFLFILSSLFFLFQKTNKLLPNSFMEWRRKGAAWGMTTWEHAVWAWAFPHCRALPLLAQRLITLVLMMINSCSYSTNDLVFI